MRGGHRTERDEGFTLIEVLAVALILGILAAIAIPTFLRQREHAWDAVVKSDLHNAAITQETVFAENGAYGDGSQLVTEGFTESRHVDVVVLFSDPERYCMAARHVTGATWWYVDSDVGAPTTAVCT